MSGELKPELSVAVGDEVIVINPDRRYRTDEPKPEPRRETVIKAARVWITTDSRRRFRRDSQSESTGAGWGGWHFRTEAQHAYRERVISAWEVLKAHGLAPDTSGYRYTNTHDAELFAVAALLEKGVEGAPADGE